MLGLFNTPRPPGCSLSSGPAVAGGSAENREEGHSFPGTLGKAAGWLAPTEGSLFQTPAFFLPALHSSCDHRRLCSQQPPGLPVDVCSDGLQRGHHFLAPLVSPVPADHLRALARVLHLCPPQVHAPRRCGRLCLQASFLQRPGASLLLLLRLLQQAGGQPVSWNLHHDAPVSQTSVRPRRVSIVPSRPLLLPSCVGSSGTDPARVPMMRRCGQL